MVRPQQSTPPGGEDFVTRRYLLPRQRIGYLRFLLESYDGLAYARTLDPQQAVVEIAWPPSRQQDVETLLATLACECLMSPLPEPTPEQRSLP
ncbi:MAG: hypothetical protein C0621_09180 [Desulfuromonas sp.]|nr:MAG: hypothetical protein C0621_09180 [Desulfuromonas sp.]